MVEIGKGGWLIPANTTTTTAVLWPFVQDYPGESVRYLQISDKYSVIFCCSHTEGNLAARLHLDVL